MPSPARRPAPVRVRDPVAEPALRHRAEPARARSARRRLQRRLRGGDRSGRRRARARHGLRRLDPDPRGWCGIVGFKPTFDLVPADGCFPLAPSYDHVGPMASTVEGCVELMRALVPGFEPAELESLEELESASRGSTTRTRSSARASRRRRRSSRGAGRWTSRCRRRQPSVHARGRGRPPRALPGERGRVRRHVDEAEPCFEVTDAEVDAARRAATSTASAARRRSTASTCS